MFLLGIVVFLGTTLMAMVMSGEIMMFVNVPSLLIVLPPALIITFASSDKQSRSNACRLLFSDDLHLNSGELNAAKQVFITFGNMNVFMGWIGVTIGIVAMGNMIDGDNMSQIFGPAFAVCTLTIFYALLIKALCYAAEAKIQSQVIKLASKCA